MPQRTDAFREHLLRVLDWEDAHVGFDKAVDGIPPDKRGVRPPGFEHSAWQLLEHIRIAQADILDFCVNAKYKHDMKWPDDYWPQDPTPPDAKTWNGSITSYSRDRDALKRIAREVEDLTSSVPTGDAKQTFLRAILLIADHTAYHVGQLVVLRRALDIWK